MTEREVLNAIKKITDAYPGSEPPMIYLRNGKIVTTGSGVRPTLAFAERMVRFILKRVNTGEAVERGGFIIDFRVILHGA